ncbi:MAG: hypothetical protein HGA53_08820 [Anaerolineaceae bacterium]|nr:hypothetical protein [Anaerolineaceae bacterium]
MENSSQNDQAQPNQSDPISAPPRRVSGIIRRLIGLFTLSKEDRSKAGIFVGSQDDDE